MIGENVEHVGVELGTLYGNPEELKKHIRIVNFDEVEENDFNLNVPRYVTTFCRQNLPPVNVALAAVRNAKAKLESGHAELDRIFRGVICDQDK